MIHELQQLHRALSKSVWYKVDYYNEPLPRGLEPRDVASEAVASYALGETNFDPNAAASLLTYLSKQCGWTVLDLMKSYDAQRVRLLPPGQKQVDKLPGTWDTNTPEEMMQVKEEHDGMILAVDRLVKELDSSDGNDNEELTLINAYLVRIVADQSTTPAEMKKFLTISESKFWAVRKRIARKLKKLLGEIDNAN